VRLLLDTQAAYWWLQGNRRMSARTRRALTHQSNATSFSVISIYEIGLKVRRGLLTDIHALKFRDGLMADGFAPLLLTADHMEKGALLDWRHRDPWDRLMAAQAMVEGLSLVSSDEVFDELALKRLW
jgi:PIN domain nuclease of toxin-antitoxin system